MESEDCEQPGEKQWLTGTLFRMLLITKKGLEDSKELIANYKLGKIAQMSPDLWHAKKVVDATIHPGALLFDAFLHRWGGILTRNRYG